MEGENFLIMWKFCGSRGSCGKFDQLPLQLALRPCSWRTLPPKLSTMSVGDWVLLRVMQAPGFAWKREINEKISACAAWIFFFFLKVWQYYIIQILSIEYLFNLLRTPQIDHVTLCGNQWRREHKMLYVYYCIYTYIVYIYHLLPSFILSSHTYLPPHLTRIRFLPYWHITVS